MGNIEHQNHIEPKSPIPYQTTTTAGVSKGNLDELFSLIFYRVTQTMEYEYSFWVDENIVVTRICHKNAVVLESLEQPIILSVSWIPTNLKLGPYTVYTVSPRQEATRLIGE